MDSVTGRPRLRASTGLWTSGWARLGMFAAVIAFHVAIYSAVNLVNGARDPTQFWNLFTPFDSWIPYLGWTGFIYYFGDLYMGPWAAIVVVKLDRGFERAMKAYVGMVVVGGAIQVLIPASAPLPAEFHWLQARVHELSIPPYACLPSMHVALSALPAALSMHVLKSPLTRGVSVGVAALITLSTLTTKEHFFLDAVAGLALAALAYAYWRRGIVSGERTGQGSGRGRGSPVARPF